MKIGTVVDCKNGHVFRLGLTDDGFRDCPDCGELLSNPKSSSNTFGLLTIGQAWRNKRKAERMQSKPNHKELLVSLGLDLGTITFEKKLRAIAKHATALADELDVIDNQDTVDELAKELANRIDKELRPKVAMEG